MRSIEQYFNELSGCLGRLSAEDREESLNFYREYALEAGIMNYDEMAARFGSPKELSANIYADAAVKHLQQESTQKGGAFNSFIIVLMALFSMPFAFPLAITVSAVVFALLVSLAAIVFALFVTVGSVGVSAVVLFVKSFGFLLPFAPALFFRYLGSSLVLLALTALAALVLIKGVRWLLRILTVAISKYIKRRNDRD